MFPFLYLIFFHILPSSDIVTLLGLSQLLLNISQCTLTVKLGA